MHQPKALIEATLRATAFLTRLSISNRVFESLGGPAEAQSPENAATGEPGSGRPATQRARRYQLGDDAHAFPLVGLVAAAPAAILLLVLPALGLSPLVCGFVAVAALVATTGALHEDGLADVADGLFGHQPREKALEIMHDSRVGTYGAVALVLSLGLRAALLAELCATRPLLAAAAILATASASRGAMAAFWALTPPATGTGLAARAGRPSRPKGEASLLIGGVIALCLGLPLAGLLPTLAAAALAAVGLVLLRRFVLRRIGGQTGDCLGAAQQLCEMALLLGVSLGS
ncbi:adenosylcobinamide-GDP ribazoletransferase [Jiella avicenniae]|uniref:Adenosylcobinamide-GDP ribazoletransferase n=1 Tax=Jiella avicenniae TaxID=2907202 RepID=A0A9X1NZY7_9HYPH|nr:adenosylcobinamide-GDP ribazoletransferase [Jiella avicenniae]MCE7027466.1 adenosylcobinamide-GDP ribazoletransferase [Jiella avicenniae]